MALSAVVERYEILSSLWVYQISFKILCLSIVARQFRQQLSRWHSAAIRYGRSLIYGVDRISDTNKFVHSHTRYSRVLWTRASHKYTVFSWEHLLMFLTKHQRQRLYLIMEALFIWPMPSKPAQSTTVPSTTMPRTTSLGRWFQDWQQFLR